MTTPEASIIAPRVLTIVAESLDRPRGDVHLHSSLIDDLGAESIDLLDILFRLESAFSLKIPAEELWKGKTDVPRLITVQTIVDYLAGRLAAGGTSATAAS